MISEKSFSIEWIEKISKDFKVRNLNIPEKAIKALYQREKLCESKLKFTFKGGTALTILFNEEKRFSTDIDIITLEEKEIFEKTLEEFVFKKYFKKFETDKREIKSKIKKTHYRFFYDSVISGDEQNVLLDIVFCELAGVETKNVEIKSKFIIVEKPTYVNTLSKDSLLGDKLTTLAISTIGIPIENDLSIAKQIYDIDRLFEEISNLKNVKKAFEKICKIQCDFRGKNVSIESILNEIIEIAIVYGKGFYQLKLNTDEEIIFKCINSGLEKLQSNLIPSIEGKVSKNSFLKALSKIAYLCSVFKTKELINFSMYNLKIELENLQFYEHKNSFNKLKNLDKETHYYFISTIKYAGLDRDV